MNRICKRKLPFGNKFLNSKIHCIHFRITCKVKERFFRYRYHLIQRITRAVNLADDAVCAVFNHDAVFNND